jgi:UDP-GlcNAc:undecaprenyl-phosphate GlcNAc-1-phosphate transferase
MWIALVVAVAFAVAALATHFLRPLSLRLGLIDHPDGARKRHDAPTPLVGGLGVLAGLAAAGAMVLLKDGYAYPEAGALLLAALPIVLIGLWDDHNRAGASTGARLVAQLLAALVMVYAGDVVIRDLGDLTGSGRPVLLGVWAVPFTIVCIVGAINAFNMIDGMDGLAGGAAVVALAWYAIAGASQGAPFEMMLAFVCMGAVGGFLVFNMRHPFRQRAAVFLGDTGSMLLGMIVVWLAIALTQGPGRSFPPMATVWVLGLPLLDTLSVIPVRLAQGRSPLSPDRNHLHFMLMRAGLNERETVSILLMAACGFGAIGIGAWQLRVPEPVLFYGSFTVYFIYLLALSKRQAIGRWAATIRGAAQTESSASR